MNKHRLLTGKNQGSVELKAQLVSAEWDLKWNADQERAAQREARNAWRSSKEEGKDEAKSRTEEAAEALAALEGLLVAGVDATASQPWRWLMEDLEFSEATPQMGPLPSGPVPDSAGWEPVKTDKLFQPDFSWLDRLWPARKAREIERREQSYKRMRAEWEADEQARWARHADAMRDHEAKVQLLRDAHAVEMGKWQQQKSEHEARAQETNADAHKLKSAYEQADPDAVVWFCENVLSDSEMPDCFCRSAKAQYLPDSKTAVVNLDLPAPEALPRLKAVRFVATREEFEEHFITEVQAAKLYDDVLYKAVLRAAHELFAADYAAILDAIVLNGIVTAWIALATTT